MEYLLNTEITIISFIILLIALSVMLYKNIKLKAEVKKSAFQVYTAVETGNKLISAINEKSCKTIAVITMYKDEYKLFIEINKDSNYKFVQVSNMMDIRNHKFLSYVCIRGSHVVDEMVHKSIKQRIV